MKHFSALALGLSLLALPAQAALLGTNVSVKYNYSTLSQTVDVVTVGSGVELGCPSSAQLCTMLSANGQAVDIGDLSITYTYNNFLPGGFDNVTPNGFLFDDLLPGGDIIGFQLTTGIAGLDPSRITFTPHSLSIDMRGLGVGTSNYFTVTLDVPEPASLSLLGLGLLGLTGLRRRG